MALGACSETAPAPIVERDSAGVRIVESLDPQWGEVPAWDIGTEPMTVIGVAEGREAHQLYRIAGATRLSDGTVVVANAGTHELRAFSESGEHRWSAGRQGEGPGEFQSLTWMHRIEGDSLLSFDQRLDRLTIYDGSGNLVRSFKVGGSNDVGAFPRLPLHGGRLFASARTLFQASQLESGVRRDSAQGLMFSMTGELLDTVGVFPGTDTYLETDGRSITVVEYPFGRSTYYAASGSQLYVGDNAAYEIRTYSPRGVLERVIRRRGVEKAITGTLLKDRIEEILEGIESDGYRRRVEQIYDDLPTREGRLPAYSEIAADTDGYLWVREYPEPGELGNAWDVFGPGGRWLGSVQMPADLDVLEIGIGYVLGVWESELGVEQIRLYPVFGR
jgi:hypothetical protein